MKYIRFNRNAKAEYNLIFIYEDKLSTLNKSVFSDTVLEDIKLAISNNLVTGASGSMNTFSSKMYEKNYFLIGLGQKSKLTIQTYEKNLNSALKKINSYNINSISIDLNNIAIKGYDHIKAGIIELKKLNIVISKKIHHL